MRLRRPRTIAILLASCGVVAALGVTVPAEAGSPPLPPGCTGTGITATSSTPVSISTSGTPTVTATLAVSSAAEIRDVDVTTNLTHTFAADINMTLTSPAGTAVTLTTDNGGGNDNVFNGTVWDDDANPGGQVPYTTNNGLVTDHVYADNVPVATLVPEEPLSAFIGEMTNGSWILTISDDATADGGTLSGWSLSFGQAGTRVDTSSVLVADGTDRTVPAGPAVVTSDITVSGAGSYLNDLDLVTGIEHTTSADLDMTLRSPAGTVATISSDNGGSNDDVFDGVVWDDEADPGHPVPYSNNERLVTDRTHNDLSAASPLAPEESFGAFVGENPNGVWRMTISDDAAENGGLLDGWAVLIKSGYCGNPRPDARIKRGAAGPPAGNDVYNTTGVDQSRTGSAPRGGTVTYFVPAQNDATFAEPLRLAGAPSARHFTVSYFAPDGANITGAVTAGTHMTPSLAPGASYVVKVLVQVKTTAPAGASLARRLSAFSTADPGTRDTVMFTTSRA